MKLTNLAFILLFVVLFISRESFCQENKYQEIKYNVSALIGTGGYSWPTIGGGSLSGINYSLSGGIQLSKGVNLALQADYTSFGLTQRAEGDISVSYQPNPITSFSLELIPKLWGLNIILGGGVSSQKTDAVLYNYYDQKEQRASANQGEEIEGADGPKFHGVFGLGGDIKLIKELSLVLQTRLFIGHNYSSLFWETGLKYNF